MVEELVFTSAQRGLEVGKSGFCTVASSAGMAANLARLLQSLSGYRHLHAPGTPEAASNPVAYSHLKTKVGGKEFSILSRICDADIDYSNRSNKLAHHFAIDRRKRPTPTPVAILTDESQFYCQWDEAPKKLPPRTLVGSSLSPSPCDTWGKVIGDPGWAGDLIEAVIDKRPVYLIINEQTPALKLISEALSLLPRRQQWDVTFSTFFTKLPPSVDCAVRCVMAGSAEVGLARRSQKNLVLDLTAPLGMSESNYADAARNGSLAGVAGTTDGNEFDLSRDQPASDEEYDYELTMDDRHQLKETDEPASQPSGRPPAAPPRMSHKSKVPSLASPEIKSRTGLKLGIAAVVAMVLIGGGVATYFAVPLIQATEQVASSPTPAGDKTEADKVEANRAEADWADTEKAEAEKANKAEANKAEADKAEADKAEADRAEADRAEAEKANRAEADRAEAEKAEAEKADKAEGVKVEAEKAKLDKLTITDFKFHKDLPGEGEFGAHYKSNQQIATVNRVLPESIQVEANDDKIQFERHQQELNTWAIKDADGNYGKLRIDVNKDKKTSTLYLTITNFSRASDNVKLALRSGFKLNGIDVRVVAESRPPLIYAIASSNFKLKELKFDGSTALVHPVFTPASAKLLASQLNDKISQATGKDKIETIELGCKCNSDDQIEISGFESRAHIILKIIKRKDGSFKMGNDEGKSLAVIINEALIEEKTLLFNRLKGTENQINYNRAEQKRQLEKQPNKNFALLEQLRKQRPFKWKQEEMNYNQELDKVPNLQDIKSWKQKRKKAIETIERKLGNGDFKGIVLPVENKANPQDPARHYVIFGNSLEDENAEEAIKAWEETNRGGSNEK